MVQTSSGGPAQDPNGSFNSSVGIRLVQTSSSSTKYMDVYLVSIPRSEFGWFRPTALCHAAGGFHVSIPRSEFGWFRRGMTRLRSPVVVCFNSSVGIRLVQTRRLIDKILEEYYVSIPRSEFGWFRPRLTPLGAREEEMFQFLGRNSVGSDHARGYDLGDQAAQFQFLGRNSVGSDQGMETIYSTYQVFQFLGRNSVGSDEKGAAPGLALD